MTFSEIITEVTLEVGQDSSDTTLAANLLSFCQAALRRIPKRVRDRSILKIDTVTLSSGAQTASLPSDFIKERPGPSIWRINDGRRIPIEKISFREFNLSEYTTQGSGVPAKCRIYGSVIEVNVPADQAYTIYMEYFKALAVTAIATTDTFALREDAVEPFKDMVKSYYFGYEEDMRREDGYFSRALAYFQEMDDEFSEEEHGDFVEITE